MYSSNLYFVLVQIKRKKLWNFKTMLRQCQFSTHWLHKLRRLLFGFQVICNIKYYHTSVNNMNIKLNRHCFFTNTYICVCQCGSVEFTEVPTKQYLWYMSWLSTLNLIASYPETELSDLRPLPVIPKFE